MDWDEIEQIQEKFPFLSGVRKGENEFICIIQNADDARAQYANGLGELKRNIENHKSAHRDLALALGLSKGAHECT